VGARASKLKRFWNAFWRVGLVVLGVDILAAALLFISTWNGSTFKALRVGSAGEWFSGFAASAVFAWALFEPRRTRQRESENAAHERSERAAQAIRESIADLGYRPGGPPIRPAEDLWQMHTILEVYGPLLASDVARERVRVTVEFVRRMFVALNAPPTAGNVRQYRRVVPHVLESTSRQLLSVIRREDLPPWHWEGGPHDLGPYDWPESAENVVDWMYEHGMPLQYE
jgi:hypothetical protein